MNIPIAFEKVIITNEKLCFVFCEIDESPKNISKFEVDDSF